MTICNECIYTDMSGQCTRPFPPPEGCPMYDRLIAYWDEVHARAGRMADKEGL